MLRKMLNMMIQRLCIWHGENLTLYVYSIDKQNKGEKNRIIFGALGTGKSHKLEKDSAVFGDNVERVTFHPNYSFSQFVGTYKPIQGENPGDNNI